MSEDHQLPSLGDVISNWLGFRLPALPLPQTVRNLDKAAGKVLLAGGENLEARIRANSTVVRAGGKIKIAGMFRNEEERRKLENRAAVLSAAVEEISANPPQEDAGAEIEDDWLNSFVRLAEDKSSADLQQLFGKLLSGEIARPGSFSLRALQVVGTMSRQEAEVVSEVFAYVLDGHVLPLTFEVQPSFDKLLLLEELGLATAPGMYTSGRLNLTVSALSSRLLAAARNFGICIENKSQVQVTVRITGQLLTSAGRDLFTIANPPATDTAFLKSVMVQIVNSLRQYNPGLADLTEILVHLVTYSEPLSPETTTILYTQEN